MSETISWRPSPEAAKALIKLMEQAGGKRKRSQVLNDAVIAAARGPEIVADNDRKPKSAPVARQRLGLDRDRIAAFQKQAGMTTWDARKRK